MCLASRFWFLTAVRCDESIMEQIEFSGFRTACKQCGEAVSVRIEERVCGVRCAECGSHNGPWPNVLSAEMLPDLNSTNLQTFIQFSNAYNPIRYLRAHLGTGFELYVNTLSARFIPAFKADQKAVGTVGELLTILAYQIEVMPYLGVSADNARKLCRWFVEGIERSVKA